MSSNVSNFTSDNLTDTEKRLFDRNLRLPGWNQAILKKSTVLIIGVGGLGVEVAKNLAMVGVGHLILVDMDTIEYSNFNRQILFVGAPEGGSKAEVAAKKLHEINPFIKIEGYNCPLQELDPKIYQAADLYIAGLDSVRARIELNRRAVHNNKPLIDAGTAAYNGHIYCFFPSGPQRNACLECDPLHERERDQLGACTIVGKPRKPIHCVLKAQLEFQEKYNRDPDILDKKGIEEIRTSANNWLKEFFPDDDPFTVDIIVQLIDAHEPTVITINCVMASIQSQEAVKILHHIHSPEYQRLGTLQLKYIIYNGLTGKFYELEKPPNPKCEMCGEGRIPLFKLKADSRIPLKMIIDKLVEKKNFVVDSEFPPSVFRIDSYAGLDECSLDKTLKELGIRNYETLLVTGFANDRSLYIQLKYEA